MSALLDERRCGRGAHLAGGRAVEIGGDGHVPVRAVPGRDPVAPPQLARDVPVPDARHPVLPHLDEPLGEDLRLAVPGGLERRRRERSRPDEPLRLEPRLNDVVAALAAPDDHLVRLHPDEVATSLEVRDDRGARLVPPQPVVGRPGVGDARGVIEDRGHREVVALAGLVVVVVVGRRDLDRARPERRIDHRVRDDRHVAVHERDAHEPPDERRVPGVVRVHGDGGVAEDRLGARGRDGDGGVRVRSAGRRVHEVIPDGPQVPGLRASG